MERSKRYAAESGQIRIDYSLNKEELQEKTDMLQKLYDSLPDGARKTFIGNKLSTFQSLALSTKTGEKAHPSTFSSDPRIGAVQGPLISKAEAQAKLTRLTGFRDMLPAGHFQKEHLTNLVANLTEEIAKLP